MCSVAEVWFVAPGARNKMPPFIYLFFCQKVVPFKNCATKSDFLTFSNHRHLYTLFVCYRPTYFISSPNVIRVGVNETIVINIMGTLNPPNQAVPVTVELKSPERNDITYCRQTVDVMKSK